MRQTARSRETSEPTRLQRLNVDIGCVIAVALFTAIGAALRLWQIRSGLYADELNAYREITGASFGQVLVNVSHNSIEVSPPLFFLLANAAQRLGDPATTIRIPAEISGILLVPAVFILGKLGFNRRVGLVASALTAVNVHAIYYSVEARPYSLLMLISSISTICLLKLIDDGRRRWLVGYSLASAAAVYTHYSTVGVLIAQFVWAMWSYPAFRRRLLAGNLFAAVLFLPWLPQITFKSGAKITLATFSFGVDSVERWARQLVTLPYGDSGFSDLPGIGSLAILAICLTIGLVGVSLRAGKREYGLRPSSRQALFPILVLASPAVMLIASLITGSEFLQSRYFSASFPALMISVAAILALSGRRLGIALSAIAITASAVSAIKAEQPTYQRSDLRAVARWAEAPGRSSALIADWISPYNGPNPLRPYLKSPRRDKPAIGTANVFSQFEKAATIGANVVLVMNASFPEGAERNITGNPLFQLKLVETARWPGLGGGIRVAYFVHTPASSAKR